MDLSKALEFTQIILDRNPLEYKNKEDELAFTTFSIAIIVTYWKPFSENKSRFDAKSLLPNKCLNDFDEDELKLRNRIRIIRNSIVNSHTLIRMLWIKMFI